MTDERTCSEHSSKTIGRLDASATGRLVSPRRRMWRWVLAVTAIYAGILVLLMILEESFIFFPSRYPMGDWRPNEIAFQDIEFTTDDGVRLHGWFCPWPNARAVVLASHGNAGNVTHRAGEIALWQQRLGVSCFMYDYRGYGRSEGRPNEVGFYRDARAAYRWLTESQGIAADRVVLVGNSIGSAVALQLATEVDHAALVMQSPFTSIVEMGSRQFPWIPTRWLLRNRFESDEKISKYRGRLLITHGTDDRVVPFSMGQRLFELASQPKQFHAVPGADHNDVAWVGGVRYFAAIDELLRSAGL